MSGNNIQRGRDSAIELFRIVTMVLIVAHHYFVNSGLVGVISSSHKGLWSTVNSYILLGLGAWGKVGINCFVLITGYFMSVEGRRITLNKFMMLYLQIAFYNILLNSIFLMTGYASFDKSMVLYSLFPIAGITSSYFEGAFLVFYLLIPFLNILIGSINCQLHILLIMLLLVVYSILPELPGFVFAYNHVEWFCFLYLVAAFIRKYQYPIFMNKKLWGGRLHLPVRVE